MSCKGRPRGQQGALGAPMSGYGLKDSMDSALYPSGSSAIIVLLAAAAEAVAAAVAAVAPAPAPVGPGADALMLREM